MKRSFQLGWLALLWIFVATLAHAQGSVQIINNAGISAGMNGTGNSFNVICTSGCSGGAGGGGTYSSFGAAFPSLGTAAGFIDSSGNMAGANLDASGFLKVAQQGTVTVTGTVAATQSGTWTVQPGNTANTTAWLVTGTGGTFPVTQSTSPWVVSLASTTITGTVAVTQSTSPWVVSNGGTFAVQAAQSGTWNIGTLTSITNTVNVAGVKTNNNAVPGATNVGALTCLANAAAPTWTEGDLVLCSSDLSGNQRIVLSGGTAVIGHVITDSGSVTNATLTAETTKVIGVVRNADGAGNLLTTNSTTYTAKFGLDANLLGTLGTAFTTAGFVDIKGADGNVFVRQATASNLNATVVGTGTFVVQATLAAETTKVIGTVRNLGNAGGIFDTTQNATVPANALSVGCNFTTSPATVTTGTQGALQCNSKGEALAQLTDGTTNVGVIAGTTALKSDLSSIAGTATVTAGVSGMLAVGGNTATNVAITSNPLLIGAQAVSSENAAVTTARGVQLTADLVGKLIVLPFANPENFTQGVTAAITDTTSTSTIASAGGSLRNYVTKWSCTNSSATVGTFVKLLDGATIIDELYAGVNGGGFVATYPTPLKGTAATAMNSQAVTTGANFICSASGYKGV